MNEHQRAQPNKIPEPVELPLMPTPALPGPLRSATGKARAGYTKNKGHGQSEVRRRMTKESRRRNRR